MKKAYELREKIIENQIDIVYKRILEAASKGHFKVVLDVDFVMSDACKKLFNKLGYRIIEVHTVEYKEMLKNFYQISWE